MDAIPEILPSGEAPEGALDEISLAMLRLELEDDHALQEFLACYLRLLPIRLAEIDRAAGAGDLHRLVDQSLSLAASSGLLGAARLAAHARAISSAAASGMLPEASSLAALREKVALVASAVSYRLSAGPEPGPSPSR